MMQHEKVGSSCFNFQFIDQFFDTTFRECYFAILYFLSGRTPHGQSSFPRHSSSHEEGNSGEKNPFTLNVSGFQPHLTLDCRLYHVTWKGMKKWTVKTQGEGGESNAFKSIGKDDNVSRCHRCLFVVFRFAIRFLEKREKKKPLNELVLILNDFLLKQV